MNYKKYDRERGEEGELGIRGASFQGCGQTACGCWQRCGPPDLTSTPRDTAHLPSHPLQRERERERERKERAPLWPPSRPLTCFGWVSFHFHPVKGLRCRRGLGGGRAGVFPVAGMEGRQGMIVGAQGQALLLLPVVGRHVLSRTPRVALVRVLSSGRGRDASGVHGGGTGREAPTQLRVLPEWIGAVRRSEALRTVGRATARVRVGHPQAAVVLVGGGLGRRMVVAVGANRHPATPKEAVLSAAAAGADRAGLESCNPVIWMVGAGGASPRLAAENGVLEEGAHPRRFPLSRRHRVFSVRRGRANFSTSSMGPAGK